MSGVNACHFIGHLGKDPEVKSLDNGNKVANFSIATSKVWYDKGSGEKKEATTWVNIVMWGKVAEIAEKFLKKGSQVYVSGEYSNRSYEDKEGNTKYVHEFICNTLNLIGGKSEDSRTESNQEVSSAVSSDTDDDLPF